MPEDEAPCRFGPIRPGIRTASLSRRIPEHQIMPVLLSLALSAFALIALQAAMAVGRQKNPIRIPVLTREHSRRARR